ncbi:MAG: hypothetical protein LBW85_11000 [Deltaproteobacteria bacterium]|jgi:signal transduction histidine kinase|nr:hypothetical protein [Deltaproteobacteria bacterium]
MPTGAEKGPAAAKPRFEAGFTQFAGFTFLLLLSFVAATGALELRNSASVRETVEGITSASLPELVDTQKLLLSIENLRRFAEVAYVSRVSKSRREARLSAREIVAETIFISSEDLHEDALRVSRIIDNIVRLRTGLEKEQETIESSSVIYLQSLESLGPYLRTPQDRQTVFGLFLEFFLSPREDFAVRPHSEASSAFQKHIRDVQLVCDRLAPDLGPSGQSALEGAMRNIDSSLHMIEASLARIDAANTDLNDQWFEIDQILRGMRDRIRIGGESNVESALSRISEAARRASRNTLIMFASLIALLAVHFALLYVFMSKPLKWTSRKLQEIQDGILDTPAPVIRVREVADLARLLDRFSSRIGDLYSQANRFEAEAAAKKDIEEIMRAVFIASLDGYVVWRNGGVELVSPMTLKLLGLDGREEFLEGHRRFGFSARRLAEVTKMAAFEKSVREETTLTSKYGTQVPVELTHLPVTLRGNDCLLTYIRDLRRQKRSEEALREAKEQAEAAATAKIEFLANMSHEIMTPMNGILGLIRMVLSCPLESEQRQRLAKAEDEAMRFTSVMQDILDYSAIDVGNVGRAQADFRIEEVLKAALDGRAAAAYAKGLDLFMKIPPMREAVFSGDLALLYKVLDRLVDNAVKFTDRGYVSVEAAELLAEERAGDSSSVALLFTVNDTGSGISPGESSRLFSAFSQVDGSAARRHRGTGLGLAFAKKAVELMGGRLWCDSRPGMGSSFHFTARFRASEPSAARLGSDMAFRGKAAVVCAPATPGREALLEFLNYFFLDLRVADTAEEALNLMDAQGPSPDVVLADVKVRGGPDQLARALQDRRAAAGASFRGGPASGGGNGLGSRVILMGPRTEAQGAVPDLYIGFLEKPFSLDTLSAVLSKAFAAL